MMIQDNQNVLYQTLSWGKELPRHYRERVCELILARAVLTVTVQYTVGI